jgi:hypothetical protein
VWLERSSNSHFIASCLNYHVVISAGCLLKPRHDRHLWRVQEKMWVNIDWFIRKMQIKVNEASENISNDSIKAVKHLRGLRSMTKQIKRRRKKIPSRDKYSNDSLLRIGDTKQITMNSYEFLF